MLVYDFIFTAADYSGTTAHIYGLGGAEIAESPVTLDVTGRFSLSLDEGTYYAVTSSPRRGLNNAQAQGVLNMPASIAAGGGGVSGSAAWFTFSAGPADLLTKGYVDFEVLDDGRATPRPDLLVVADGDATTLTVVEGGEYLIQVTSGGNLVGNTPDVDGLVRLSTNVEINDDNEAPAYYMPVDTLFVASSASPPVNCLSFQQTLVAGDVIQVGARIRLLTAEVTAAFWMLSGSLIGFTKIG